VKEIKDKAVNNVTKSLEAAGLSQNDLSIDFQDWRKQIDVAEEEENAVKIEDIESKVLADIEGKKEDKARSSKLDDLKEKLSNDNDKQQNNKVFAEVLKEANKNIGNQENEVKVQELKQEMREKDPEIYFETFVKWVEEELKVIEVSKDELEEDERNLIEGKITDQNKAKETEKRLEEKIETKKQSQSFSQKINEWQNWLKTTAVEMAINHFQEQAKIIKKHVYSLKSSTNPFKRNAYEANKQRVNNLFSELNAISRTLDIQTVPPTKKNLFRPEVMVPVSLVAVLAIAFAVIIRRKKRIKAK
jgi:hypothetical protein